MTTKKKVFILDTNVLLHDYKCLHNFQDNDIVIPITVLEELDKFKKGFDQINFNARQIARDLDLHCEGEVFTKGVSMGKGMGNLFIETSHKSSEFVKANFPENTPDHRILAIAEHVSKTRKEPVIFVSKDINLRIKAKAIGIPSEDYETDKVEDMNIFSGPQVIKNVDPNFIVSVNNSTEPIFKADIPFKNLPTRNAHLVLKSKEGELSALVYFDVELQQITAIHHRNVYGIKPRNEEQRFAFQALLNPKIPLVSITGKAGTGKTLLALAAALEQVDDFEQILLARPIVQLSNRDLGFLPGDANEKIGPYMLPLYDNLDVIKSYNKKHGRQAEKIDQLQKDKIINITPLAYIRGRSLNKTYFIVDEAQNLTPHEVKTIITRAGEGTKIIFTGDVQQIDTPYLDERSNGLSYLTDRLKNEKLFMHIHLQTGERSALAEMASNLL
ncbi:MAG: PhoH family protein [Salinivirgaceae bacterium]|nr:PhoH family protein [Salinivirgaceae bacterium]MDD4748266.1 PhoH family protein [Salinivirgaceae bacterium]MDY0280515.1 PhoH family protein [Salinivirgaceae bacterium]